MSNIELREMFPEHYVNMTLGVLINKLNRDTLNALTRKLKRFLIEVSSTSKRPTMEFLEVNSFLFAQCSIPLSAVATTEQRKSVIQGLEQIIHNYCNQECSNYSKQIRKNVEIKDITKILINLVKSSGVSGTIF